MTQNKNLIHTYRTARRILITIFLFSAFSNPDAAVPPMGATLRSGSELDYPPFCIVDANGRADGFAVELMRAAVRAMGREVAFRTGPWAEVKNLLAQGEIDALPLVGRTPEREPIYDFTFPYLSVHGAIVVRKGETTIRELNDLIGRRVAVMKSDNAEEFLRRTNLELDLQTTTTFEDALRGLSEGRYDCALVARLPAMYWIKKNGWDNLAVGQHPLLSPEYCYAVLHGQTALLAQFSEALKALKESGEYRRIYNKWMGVYEDAPPNLVVV